jgi:hypothetical protein
MLDTLGLIADYPHLEIRNARDPELRSRPVGRYPNRIHYLIENAEIWVVHIRHSARRPFDPEPE